MNLKEISIENFRGIKKLNLSLDNLTVLIGENNIGKSTILDAIRLVLTHGFTVRRAGQLTEYDFHLGSSDATPQKADPITIILHFAESEMDEWSDETIQQLNEVIQIDNDGLNHIWLCMKGAYQPATSTFDANWSFLNPNGITLQLRNNSIFNILSRLVPIFFLSALRDASHEFGQRGHFWSSFLKTIQLPDEKREEIERVLNDINSSVINADAGLTEVAKKIATTGRIIPLAEDNPVVLEAIPTRVFDMVNKIQVFFKSIGGAKIPLQRYGEGTQSLSVLMLFQAFTEYTLSETYAPESTPILALEEPEAHLHPSAIRMIGTLLGNMPGQVLVTSHSGELISRVPVTSIRRLYKKNGETKVGYIDKNRFVDREIQAINYSIKLTRGHYLFSRCWLFVEGESDFHIMPLLFDAMGHSQDSISFSVIEISQVIDKGEPLIKFAQALGIEWFLMADGDAAGRDYAKRARKLCRNGEKPSDRTKILRYNDIEHEFWYNGYNDFISGLLTKSELKSIKIQAAGDNAKEVKMVIKAAIKKVGRKPAFAQLLAKEIEKRGVKTIPSSIQDVINRIVTLAGGQ